MKFKDDNAADICVMSKMQAQRSYILTKNFFGFLEMHNCLIFTKMTILPNLELINLSCLTVTNLIE